MSADAGPFLVLGSSSVLQTEITLARGAPPRLVVSPFMMPPLLVESREYAIGWGTLSLINAGLAQAKRHSGPSGSRASHRPSIRRH